MDSGYLWSRDDYNSRANMKYKNLMIMLHGYGSNGDDLMALKPFFDRLLPDTYFYSPNGIEECELGVYGYQWFSLMDRTDEAIQRELDTKGEKIKEMIEAKMKEVGVSHENTILLGFSQGTMLSMYLNLSSDVAFKAVLGFSGRLFLPKEVKNKTTPICLIHGKDDDVVPYSSLDLAKGQLDRLGIKVDTLGIENLAHSIDMEGINFAVNFLK